MSLNRRNFLRNFGSFIGALSVGLTVFKPQKRKILLLYTHRSLDSSGATMVGFRGSQFFETGYVYTPYIPLYQTCELVIPNVATKQFAKRWTYRRLTFD